MTGVCDDDDVRLVGEDFYYGLVEICTENVWNTVCIDDFEIDEVEVADVCKEHLLKLFPEDSLGVHNIIAEVL